ncbi:MAG TPA: ABC transporter substrate-binding protein [Candidatus Baltobacteraceae bacterium]|nr:ABC transporter substrate-binding protein [Candidatus Baltobacteraceae bacterium]
MRTIRLMSSICAIAVLLSGVYPAAPVSADSAPIHIAVITDMSGVYSSLAGKGSVTAVQMAVDDFGGKVLGRSIVVDAVDHRDSATVADAKARQEFSNGADLAVDLTNSATALAVSSVGKEMHKLVIVTGAADKDITGKFCNKYTYMYAYDTYALAHAEAIPIVKGGDKLWYGVAPDYAFGHSMAEEFTNAIQPYGGKFVKIDFMPLGTTDFSSYMLAAKNSGAKVLALLNAGADTVNSMKAAKEFGLDKSMKIIAGLFFTSQVNTDPNLWTGLKFADSWYWDQTPQAAAWARRWEAKMGGDNPPDSIQAADYSATLQWLKAVKAVGSTDADKVVGYLDGHKFNDMYAVNGEFRTADHQVLHNFYLYEVLAPSQYKEKNAWLKIIGTIPGSEAFPNPATEGCAKTW